MTETPANQLEKMLGTMILTELDRKGEVQKQNRDRWIQIKTQIIIAKNLEQINQSLKLIANSSADGR